MAQLRPAEGHGQESVLKRRFIRVEKTDGTSDVVNLPGLFALATCDDLDEISGLRPHQRHHAHMFLSQLAAMAMEKSSPRGEDDWRKALLAISGKTSETAWDLVAKDDQPAFMQPAVPPGLDLKTTSWSVSSIDILALSKNHRVKREMMFSAGDEAWFWSLVTLQTASGYSGKMNYGIFRMNGGYGSRVLWAVYDRAWGPGRRILEDARLMNAEKAKAESDFGYGKKGHKLLWLPEWNGKDQLRIKDIDYRAIEVSRRVRLGRDSAGNIFARIGNSEAARVDMPDSKGVCGDIWAPVENSENETRVMPMKPEGFSYRRVARGAMRLPGAPVSPPPATMREVEDPILVTCAIINGRGKTDGLHCREIPFGRAAPDLFRDPTIGEVAELMIKEAAHASSSVMRGFAAYLDRRPSDMPRAYSLVLNRHLDGEIDEAFFEHLPAVKAGIPGSKKGWITHLWLACDKALKMARLSAPVRVMEKYRLEHVSQAMFHSSFWKDTGGVKVSLYKGEILGFEESDSDVGQQEQGDNRA